jgi:hypothetical protein
MCCYLEASVVLPIHAVNLLQLNTSTEVRNRELGRSTSECLGTNLVDYNNALMIPIPIVLKNQDLPMRFCVLAGKLWFFIK